MKLSPELPARQILPHKPRHVPAEGTARADLPDALQPETAPQASAAGPLSLGLPGDSLSACLLSLAKFFSLPLDTRLLLQLRRQALSLAPPQTPRNGGPETPDRPLAGQLRSAALAAAAAAGKGVTLSPEALGSYAAALAVDGPDAEAPEDEPEDRRETPGDPWFAPFPGDDLPRGRLLAERIEERSPLLGIVNRIPGRDGRRWISLPFTFQSGGLDFRVSLRISLADANGIPWKAERMALEVQGPRRRWSFLLENPGDGQAFDRAVFGVQPPLRAGAERALRDLLGSLAGKVVPRNGSGGALPEEAAEAAQWEG
jgi:hypothetical protein